MNFSEMSLHFGAVGALAPPGRLGLIGVTTSVGMVITDLEASA